MPVRKPPYSITGSLTSSVEAELEWLLARARTGELVGLAWAVEQSHGPAQAGAAGSLARDELKASGALLRAAINASKP